MAQKTSNELQAMRRMAWQRAKGELAAMLETYFGDPEGQFDLVDAAISEFVEKIQDEIGI